MTLPQIILPYGSHPRVSSIRSLENSVYDMARPVIAFLDFGNFMACAMYPQRLGKYLPLISTESEPGEEPWLPATRLVFR